MESQKDMPKTDSSDGRAVKITEVRTYIPLSHDYADLFANLVAALELCAATEELWEIWEDKLKDENSKQLLQRMIVIFFQIFGIS
jgi:succinate dehydrogenase hydrophobic anchor subunit